MNTHPMQGVSTAAGTVFLAWTWTQPVPVMLGHRLHELAIPSGRYITDGIRLWFEPRISPR